MNDFLAGILSGINSIVNNYGWSIVVFTILIKLALFPFDFKSRKSMRRMSAVQPEITKLQKKYANDKEKMNRKVSELYTKEKINPLSSCVPMLITMPVLFAMFAAMRMIANQQLAMQAIDMITTGVQNNEAWLWVRNLWMPDSPFSTVIANQSSLTQIPADIWAKVFASLDASQVSALASLGEGLAITAENISGDTIFAALSQIPTYEAEMARWATLPEVNLIFTRLTIYAKNNGWFILPLLSAATNFLITLTQPTQQTTAPAADGQAAPGMGAFMKFGMPLFSLFICATSNAAFALYWVMSNVVSGVQGFALNKYFDAKDKRDAQVTVGEGTIK